MDYTHFIVTVHSPRKLKNKLEAEVYSLIKKLDRSLWKESFVGDFKWEFLGAIDRLNQKYPRCKRIKVEFFFPHRGKIDCTVIFEGTAICTMQLIGCIGVADIKSGMNTADYKIAVGHPLDRLKKMMAND